MFWLYIVMSRTSLGEFELVASNIVRILNMMREYQFREELIRSLKSQIKDKKKKIEEVEENIQKAKSVLQNCVELMESIPRKVVETNEMDVENNKNDPVETKQDSELAKQEGSRKREVILGIEVITELIEGLKVLL